MHDAESFQDDRTDAPDAMAAVWHARLREPSVTPEEREAFACWLAADPSHGDAFARTGRLWRHLEMPAAVVQRASEDRSPPELPSPQSRRRWGVGLAAALVAFGVFAAWSLGWGDMAIARLRADYVTAIGARSEIVLGDGSHVVLDSDSAIAVHLSPQERRVTLLRGRVRFDVRRTDGRPFRVATPSGIVTVAGTVFDVRLSGASALVSLERGRVEMRTGAQPAAAPTVLAPGQEARLGPTGISAPTRFDRTEQNAWLKDQIVFHDAPLSSVVAELDRYYPGRILIANNALASRKLSGAFSTRMPVRAMEAIGDIIPVKITVLSDFLIVVR